MNKLKIHKVFHQIPVIKNEFEIFDEFNLIVQNFNNNKVSDFNKFEDSVDDIKKNMKKYKSLKFNSCNNITDNIKYLKKIVDIYENDYNVRRRSFTSEYTEKEFLSDLNKLLPSLHNPHPSLLFPNGNDFSIERDSLS